MSKMVTKLNKLKNDMILLVKLLNYFSIYLYLVNSKKIHVYFFVVFFGNFTFTNLYILFSVFHLPWYAFLTKDVGHLFFTTYSQNNKKCTGVTRWKIIQVRYI